MFIESHGMSLATRSITQLIARVDLADLDEEACFPHCSQSHSCGGRGQLSQIKRTFYLQRCAGSRAALLDPLIPQGPFVGEYRVASPPRLQEHPNKMLHVAVCFLFLKNSLQEAAQSSTKASIGSFQEQG